MDSEERPGLDWWSLQPLVPVQIPLVKSTTFRRQPVDDFVMHRLETRDLSISPPAERRVLIRRISFDLLGLPPSPEEVDQFLNDDRPDAFERLVDRILASPHYGERWARHWLDVVRFGESNGFERDLPRPNAWHYRDWVIEALNRDMPYDEFARWQLAGDLIAPENVDGLKSVGFLVAGAHDTVVPVVDRMRAAMRQDELEDIVGTVGQTFLGLTVNCARCHDHKYDPITTREYYQLASALSGIDHGEREFTPLAVIREVAELQNQILEIEADIAGETLNRDRSTSAVLQLEFTEVKNRHADLSRNGPVNIYTAIATQPPPMKVHHRGSVTSLGDEVPAAGLSAIQGLSPDFGLRPDAIESHRRQKLANWITDSRNPLFLRTIVNRVWHYHFGTGLVESPNDLGLHSEAPSHPELLDWLAGEFRSYSLKRLHRLLVTSATYRQTSTFHSAAATVDVNNRLLWRMSPRRLDAESVRDAMLAVAGQLNTQVSGKGYSDTNSYFFKGTQFYDPIDPIGFPNQRRTIYRMWARGGRSPFLDTFDCPDPSTTAPRRSATVTPLQALSLLNQSFSLRMADEFANRLTSETGPKLDAQIRLAFHLLFAREPELDELELSRNFAAEHGLPEFCRALWNSSEFLFID